MTPTPSTSRTPTPALDAALDEWEFTLDDDAVDHATADTSDVDDETARAQTRRAVTSLATTTDSMTLSELADALAADTALSRPVWCDVVERGLVALETAHLVEQTDTSVRWTGADRPTGTPAGGPTTP